jgi:hypothetical protein
MYPNAAPIPQSQSYQPYAYGAPPVDLNNPMIQMAAASGAQFFDSGHRMIQSNVGFICSFYELAFANIYSSNNFGCRFSNTCLLAFFVTISVSIQAML